jgi:hypothetical protein
LTARAVLVKPRRAYIMRGGDPLRAKVRSIWGAEPGSIIEAAEEFDESHKSYSVRGLRYLDMLERDCTSRSFGRQFDMAVADLRSNKFAVQPLRLGPPIDARCEHAPSLELVSRSNGGPWSPRGRIMSDEQGPIEKPKRRPWKLETSIWGPRRFDADSRDFYDSPDLLKRALEADWSAANADGSIVRALGKNASRDEVAGVKATLSRYVVEIYALFDLYGALGASADISHMQFNSYRQLLGDCNLIEEDSTSSLCGSRWDELFKALNATTLAANEDHFNNKQGLNRQEFLEFIVRAARLKRSDESGTSVAIQNFLQIDIVSKVLESAPMALQNSNDFRLEHCYNEPTDRTLRKHEAALKQIFFGYSSLTTSNDLWSSRRMDIKEWLRLLDDLEFVDSQFTERNAKMCFVWSRMRVEREDELKSRRKLLQLCFEDFLEAVVRMATIKASPSAEEVEQAGFADGGEFMLQLLMGEREKLEDFLETHDPTVPASQRRGVVRPPTALALENLIARMIRQFTARALGPHDLKLPAGTIALIFKTGVPDWCKHACGVP